MSTRLSTYFQDIISDDHHVKEMLMCSGYQFGDDLQIFEFKSALSSLFLTLVSFFFHLPKLWIHWSGEWQDGTEQGRVWDILLEGCGSYIAMHWKPC